MIRHWILMIGIATLVAPALAQEIRLSDEEVRQLPEFGSLKLSDDAEQTLDIPTGYMGDELVGQSIPEQCISPMPMGPFAMIFLSIQPTRN